MSPGRVVDVVVILVLVGRAAEVGAARSEDLRFWAPDEALVWRRRWWLVVVFVSPSLLAGVGDGLFVLLRDGRHGYITNCTRPEVGFGDQKILNREKLAIYGRVKQQSSSGSREVNGDVGGWSRKEEIRIGAVKWLVGF